MARRNYSAELLEAQKNGADIVCSVAPNNGTPVVYSPRRLRDPRPWQFPEGDHYRYSGRECHAILLTTDEQFFFDHAGWSYDPENETPITGHKNTAKALADAEKRAREIGWWVEWTDDPEPLSGDCYDGTEYGFVATLYRHDTVYDCQVNVNSLGGVDAPAGSPYRRVVAAELAHESL